MKIAIVVPTLFSQGAEYVAAALARGLAGRGHQVDFWLSSLHEDCRRLHPERKPFEIPANARVVVMGPRRASRSVFALRRLMRSGGYDVVMTHSSNYDVPAALAGAFLRRRPKIVCVEHGGGVGVGRDGALLRRAPFSLRNAVLNALLRRLTDGMLTVSTGNADALARMTGYPRGRIGVVYNPVVDEAFRAKREKAPRHPWLTRRGDVPTLVSAGAFTGWKDFELLIRAFARAVRVAPMRLVIFGEGPLRPRYEELVGTLGLGDRVSLPGFTNQLPAELKNADGFVVSSTVESFSVVLVEALASGLPVVSTRCPYGPEEILRGGAFGRLVAPRDVEGMAAGLVALARHEIPAAPDEAWAPYTAEAVCRRYEEFLEKWR